MAFGITEDGFQRKRLEDIQTETETDFKSRFGDEFDLDPRSPEGQLKALFDDRMALLWEALEDKYFSQYPRSSTGVNKERAVSLVGLGRNPALASIVTRGVGFGVFGTVLLANTPIVISVQGNPAARFQLNADAVISIAAVNELQTVVPDTTPTSGGFDWTFEGQTASILFNDNNAAILAKLEALTSIGAGNVAVSGVVDATGLGITFQGTLGGLPQNLATIANNTLDDGAPVAITNTVQAEGSKAKTPDLELTAENTGSIAAPAGTLTVIESVVTGLEDWTNIEDAILGNDQETDAELELRRVQEVQIAGAATPDAIRADLLQVQGVTAVVVFFNNTQITDSEGRPPKTVDLVVENGDEDQIADAVFGTVAAGIGYVGDITKNVLDSQGFQNEVKFSRPTDVDIWVEIDLIVDLSKFPQDQTLPTPSDKGRAEVADAVITYGDILGIGEDIIVNGSTPNLGCAFQDVPGIIDYTLRVGKTASPTVDDNITITPREIAGFDLTRITVVIP